MSVFHSSLAATHAHAFHLFLLPPADYMLFLIMVTEVELIMNVYEKRRGALSPLYHIQLLFLRTRDVLGLVARLSRTWYSIYCHAAKSTQRDLYNWHFIFSKAERISLRSTWDQPLHSTTMPRFLYIQCNLYPPPFMVNFQHWVVS